VGVVWKEAPESTTQSVEEGGGGEGAVCREGQGRGSDRATERGSRQRGFDRHEGDLSTGKDKRSWYVTARLRVDLNAITKNKVHGLIEGYKDAPNKLAIVKEDAHNDPVRIGRSPPRSGADSHGNGRMGSGGWHAEGGATVYGSSKVERSGGGCRGQRGEH
jgi:hypothetical protein